MSDSAHNVYWKNSHKLNQIYSLSGYSRAAENTGFYCSELEMAFDAGVPTNEMPKYICLTHLHNDHMCALNKLLIGNTKNPIIFIPNNNKFEDLVTGCLRYLYLASKFIHPESSKTRDAKTKYPYQIVRLDVGQSHCFKETNTTKYYIEALPAKHGVTAISFGLYEMRRKCKPEYQNLEPRTYAELKKKGIEFTEYYKYPIFCYVSDTNHTILGGEISLCLYTYPVMMIECTFLFEADLAKAKKKNHIHWNQLWPHIREHPNIKFLLIHFSKKYTWAQVKTFFDNFNQKTPLTNVLIWLHTGLIDYQNHPDHQQISN